jgi:GT2 family glycosyltransferase
VTHNSEKVIEECLDSLSSMAPNVEPIVVDNASRDRTVERVRMRRGVSLIANPENRGFAAAVNQGVQSTEAGFVLLMNPDTRLLTPVDPLVEAAREHGLAAGKLIGEDGRVQAGFTIRRFPTPAALSLETLGINRLWPSNPVNRRYRYLDRDLDAPGPVDQPAGAFLMARRDVWERLGGMDGDFYPIWFEDVDFCSRAAAAGYQTQYVPVVAAAHLGGDSVYQVPPGCRAHYWCVSLLRYAAKHFRPRGYKGVCAAMVLSSVPRMVAGMIQERSLTPAITCSKIVRFAVRCLLSRGKFGARSS